MAENEPTIHVQWAVSRYIVGRHDAIRVRFDVTCAEGVDNRVFAYLMQPKNPRTGEKVGFFDHVCSPADLEDYPQDEPRANEVPQWFRLSYVDVLVRSQTEADSFISGVLEDLARLKRSLSVVETLYPAGVAQFGDAEACDIVSSSSAQVPEPSSSASSSASLGPVQSLISFGGYDQNLGSGYPWTDMGDGAGSDADGSQHFSRVTLAGGDSSQLLFVQGFDFGDLPADAVVTGIQVRLRARVFEAEASSCVSSASSGSLAAADAHLGLLQLYDPAMGALVGINQAATPAPVYAPCWQSLEFGDEDDLWGHSWTPWKIKRGDFGVVLRMDSPAEIETRIVDVDSIQLEVFYRV